MVWKIRGNGALGKVFGQIRMFRGSTDECVASSGSVAACMGHEQAELMSARTLEAELMKARAFAYWDDFRRRAL